MLAATMGGREAGSGGGQGLMVLGSPSMVRAEMGCVTWKLPTVLPGSAAWPSLSAGASADKTRDKTTWLFWLCYSCPGGRNRNPSTCVRNERVADSGCVSMLERDGSLSLSCVVISTNIIQFLIIVNIQYWGWA